MLDRKEDVPNEKGPEILKSLNNYKSDVSCECGSGFNMGASVNYNVVFPSTPRSPPPLISVPLTPPPTAAQQPSPPNVNPFYLKFIKACLSGMQRESQDL